MPTQSLASVRLAEVAQPALASDQELVLAIQAGSTDALAMAYDRHAGTAFRLAMKVANDRETAEEIVQDAFTALWRSPGSYNSLVASLRTWLLSIVRHRAIDRIRARRTRPAPAELKEAWMMPAPANVQSEVQARIERGALRASVACLPIAQSRTLELAYFGGYTYVEIAETMGVPVGTVKSRARLALERLRRDVALAATVDLGMATVSLETRSLAATR